MLARSLNKGAGAVTRGTEHKPRNFDRTRSGIQLPELSDDRLSPITMLARNAVIFLLNLRVYESQKATQAGH